MFKTVSIQLEKGSAEPLYRQLFSALRNAIISGALPHGQRMPSVRKLIQTLHINNATVTHAFQLLLEENLVRARPAADIMSPTNAPLRPSLKNLLSLPDL